MKFNIPVSWRKKPNKKYKPPKSNSSSIHKKIKSNHYSNTSVASSKENKAQMYYDTEEQAKPTIDSETNKSISKKNKYKEQTKYYKKE